MILSLKEKRLTLRVLQRQRLATNGMLSTYISSSSLPLWFPLTVTHLPKALLILWVEYHKCNRALKKNQLKAGHTSPLTLRHRLFTQFCPHRPKPPLLPPASTHSPPLQCPSPQLQWWSPAEVQVKTAIRTGKPPAHGTSLLSWFPQTQFYAIPPPPSILDLLVHSPQLGRTSHVQVHITQAIRAGRLTQVETHCWTRGQTSH